MIRGWFTVGLQWFEVVCGGYVVVRSWFEAGSRWWEVGLRRFEVDGWEWFHRRSKGSQSYAVVLKCFVVV
jgi:hypothetical protein